ncbi:MAG: TonB-dependent receptor [Gammaproteobacteria bacterium]|nr:TonB-dependent receptor [Gammaproteobacteria bacterium]
MTVTRLFGSSGSLYGSVAKGYRGGGFNGASVPAQFSTYDGDTVWTYELGGKYASDDGRWFVASALYYNDYTDFIGQNALTVGPGGGLVSIDLNLGDVESYGLETEVSARVTDRWRLSGALTLMHARITDQSGWIAVTGAPLATDRLLFQPDWNVSVNSDLNIPVGESRIDWNLGVVGKGSRPGSSFDPNTPSIMESYYVVNTSLAWRRGGLSVSAFANNLLDEDYFESFIDGSLLASLGLLNQDLGLLGARRNVGVRVQYEF